MKKATLRDLSILVGITLFIFYPLFYTHYFYTDEIVQLRHSRQGSTFHMFARQGRYIPDILFQKLFSSIDTIAQITWLRLFSLFGWIACIPVWYLLLTRICRKEALPRSLPFLSVLYLVTCPPFCVYASWASCMELFIANTSGLLAGYVLYSQIKYQPIPGSRHERLELPAMAIVWTFLFGAVSLFTYQNGFGCLLLPFLLHAIAKRQWSRPLQKMAFFLTRPLASAFRFTWIVKEDSWLALCVSQSILLTWLLISFHSQRPRPPATRLLYLAGIGCLLCLIYLPSLIVKENYASNRTLLGLDLAVFILVVSTLLQVSRTEKNRLILVAVTGLFFVATAWYNFRYEFLHPVKKEYDLVRKEIETKFHPGIRKVTFIRPSQQLISDLYGVNTTWDEFGVPSGFPEWTPEDFVRQTIWEKTGNAAMADSLTIDNQPHPRADPVSRA